MPPISRRQFVQASAASAAALALPSYTHRPRRSPNEEIRVGVIGPVSYTHLTLPTSYSV